MKRLGRTRQCKLCPWRVDVDPRDIRNGYCETRHAALADTIAEPGDLSGIGGPVAAMACHEHPEGGEAHCVGWLVNQLGPGNNLPLRVAMARVEGVGRLEPLGEQHERFEDTIPGACA